jgi:hypothetical protein
MTVLQSGFFHSFLPRKEIKRPPDLWVSYRSGLLVMTDRVRSQLGKDPEVNAALIKIESLIGDRADGHRFYSDLYEAEQRLVFLMSAEDLESEASRRFDEAGRIALPVAQILLAEFVKAGTGLERKRSLIFNLLDSLHYRYQKGTLDRRARQDTALNLAMFGFYVLLVTSLGFAALFATQTLEVLGRFHVIAVLWAGLIGAYFSRIIAFQRAQAVIDYDELVKHYSWPITGVRLVIGAMGALMMYFLIKGNLVGGAFFPQILADNLIITDFSTCVEKAIDASVSSVAGTGAAAPARPNCTPSTGPIKLQMISTEMAQLLVWSLVAGFSERLIPERLSNLATGTTSPGATNTTGSGATDLALLGRRAATTPDLVAEVAASAAAGETDAGNSDSGGNPRPVG